MMQAPAVAMLGMHVAAPCLRRNTQHCFGGLNSFKPAPRRVAAPAITGEVQGAPKQGPKQPQRKQSAGKRAGPRQQGPGGSRGSSRPTNSRGSSSNASGGSEAVWRLFGVNVPVSLDPGKSDFSVHPALLAAIARRLGLQNPDQLPAGAVTLARKSFDARPKLPEKQWAYVVDVPPGALRAAGAQRLRETPGQLERLAAADAAVPSSSASSSGGGAAAGPAAAAQEAGGKQKQAGGKAMAAGSDGSRRGGERIRREDPVIVVGSGPAGLFAALTLAEAGIKVIVLERGQPVEVRGRDIGALFARGKLNPQSNLCYGEGGAGTWSDGKLTTRIGRNSDPVRRVLSALHQFGAPESILVSGKPHLGTDRLVKILKGFRQHLEARGAEVRFGCEVEDLVLEGGRVAGVRLADGTQLRASRVVLGVGHSARDIYRRLDVLGVQLTPKPFAMGFRIEHPQALIDRLQYGERDAQEVQRGKGRYPVADYRLAAEVNLAQLPPSQAAASWDAPDAWYAPLLPPPAPADLASAGGADLSQQAPDGLTGAAAAAQSSGSTTSGSGSTTTATRKDLMEGVRGVYSFCMCPGGQIVPTSTTPGELCINGMSFSRRNSLWANSALVVTVAPADWAHLEQEHGALAGMELQRAVEREAAKRGGGSFVAPVQRVSDFMEGVESQGELPSSSYRLGVRAARLHDLYPPHMTAAFRAALARFDRAMPGFAGPSALLHAAETRTSAPLRIDRGEDLQSASLPGLYPCGEGAGYAGGIVSAAVDGLRVGSAIAAEVTGVPSSLSSDFKVQMGY